MKIIRVAINGFGRIGKLVARQIISNPSIDLVAINDLTTNQQIIYNLNFDSVHGPFDPSFITSLDETSSTLLVNGKSTSLLHIKEPRKLPWDELNVDIVIECTGQFTTIETLQAHLDAGALKVILSAPGKGDIPTYVFGVNENEYTDDQRIISNASCTTNCLAPVLQVLEKEFGVMEAMMTTIHAATASQSLVDTASPKNMRLGRSGLLNIIPSTTGASTAVEKVLPSLSGKLAGMAFRVPVATSSVVDLTVKLTKSANFDTICKEMKRASKNEFHSILGYTEDPVVSQDFVGSRYSSIFDATASMSLHNTMFKLICWYDNEMGYASRMVDLLKHIAQ